MHWFEPILINIDLRNQCRYKAGPYWSVTREEADSGRRTQQCPGPECDDGQRGTQHIVQQVLCRGILLLRGLLLVHAVVHGKDSLRNGTCILRDAPKSGESILKV